LCRRDDEAGVPDGDFSARAADSEGRAERAAAALLDRGSRFVLSWRATLARGELLAPAAAAAAAAADEGEAGDVL
jgi:hypothetical protein